MGIGNKIINFKSRSRTEFKTHLKPYPALKSLPKWYKDSSPYLDGSNYPNDGKSHVRNRVANHNFKKCTPLLDGMSMGYIVPLWADVEVVSDNSNADIFWKTKKEIFEIHGPNTNSIVPPEGFHTRVFKYLNCWIPETPKGYSCLIISPIGHNDLIFRAVPAVVDTDKSTLELVFPMWVRKNFNGIVEKGTPLAQIIPFKRDGWESTFDCYEDGEYYDVIQEKNFAGTIVGHYLKNYWSKKIFK